jgi:hypothetical protein
MHWLIVEDALRDRKRHWFEVCLDSSHGGTPNTEKPAGKLLVKAMLR